jgi:hypothetical protein
MPLSLLMTSRRAVSARGSFFNSTIHIACYLVPAADRQRTQATVGPFRVNGMTRLLVAFVVLLVTAKL